MKAALKGLELVSSKARLIGKDVQQTHAETVQVVGDEIFLDRKDVLQFSQLAWCAAFSTNRLKQGKPTEIYRKLEKLTDLVDILIGALD